MQVETIINCPLRIQSVKWKILKPYIVSTVGKLTKEEADELFGTKASIEGSFMSDAPIQIPKNLIDDDHCIKFFDIEILHVALGSEASAKLLKKIILKDVYITPCMFISPDWKDIKKQDEYRIGQCATFVAKDMLVEKDRKISTESKS
ncbi:hypothetical protein LCGC14_2476610, partial [marine sediment metagenome]